MVKCNNCGVEREYQYNKVKQGRGIFCCQDCSNKFRLGIKG